MKLFTDEQSKPGVFVNTFGCQMNEYDTEKMIALLSDTHSHVSEIDKAEVVIVNTCSVREKAEHKLYSLLGKLREMKNKKPELVLGVSGCVAQQEGQSILKRNSAVDFVVGTHNLSLVPSLVKAAKQGASSQVAVDYRDEWEDLPRDLDAIPPVSQEEGQSSTSAFGVYASPVRALVAIQRGCNKKCAFCVVPTTRGPEVSRSAEEIIREIKLKVRLGAREVLLLGQTVNSYGRDLNPRYPFHKLVRKIAEIEGLKRIRFTSPHPADVKPEFIELYGDVPQLCPHIHMPLQSGSDRILKLMNRNYRVKRYMEIIEQLKTRCPDISISSDIIVGFPTETEEDFEQTLNIVEEVAFSASYSFKYSIRPNTVAKNSFTREQEVAKEVAQERLERLQSLQKVLSEDINKGFLGKKLEILVEAPSPNILTLMRGRSAQNILVEVEVGNKTTNPMIGELTEVNIEHTGAYGMRGSL